MASPDKPKRELDPEVAALAKANNLLKGLKQGAVVRILAFLASRYATVNHGGAVVREGQESRNDSQRESGGNCHVGQPCG